MQETPILLNANNKGTEQLEQMRSLISDIAIHYLKKYS